MWIKLLVVCFFGATCVQGERTNFCLIRLSFLRTVVKNVQLRILKLVYNGYGLLFHMTQATSRSIIKAIACSKPTISEH